MAGRARQNTPRTPRVLVWILAAYALLLLAAILLVNDWARRGQLSPESLIDLCVVAVIAVGLPLLPWVLGPIRIYRTIRLKTERVFEPFDPEAADTSVNVAGPIRETAAALVPLGFTPGTHLWTTSEAPRATSFLSLFEHPAARVRATLITNYAGKGKAVRRTTVLVFRTELADGREIVTNDSTVLSNLPSCPARTILNLPDVRDPAELFRAHVALLDHLGATLTDRLPVDGDPVASQREYTRREQQRWVAAGYFRPDAGGEQLRPTLKGAVLMAWKLVWPVGAIRRVLRRRRGQALLRAFRAAEGR